MYCYEGSRKSANNLVGCKSKSLSNLSKSNLSSDVSFLNKDSLSVHNNENENSAVNLVRNLINNENLNNLSIDHEISAII